MTASKTKEPVDLNRANTTEKKAYTKPRLLPLGSISTLTLTSGGGSCGGCGGGCGRGQHGHRGGGQHGQYGPY